MMLGQQNVKYWVYVLGSTVLLVEFFFGNIFKSHALHGSTGLPNYSVGVMLILFIYCIIPFLQIPPHNTEIIFLEHYSVKRSSHGR